MAGGVRRLKLDIQTPTSGELLLVPSVSFAAAIGLRTRLERPAFAITQTIPDNVHRGDKVPIAIRVSNNGATALTNVLVRVKLPKELTHPMGSAPECLIKQLAVGETQKLQLEPQANLVGKDVNVVEATADGGIQTTSRAVVNVTETGLTLRLDGPDQLPVGQQGDLRVVLGEQQHRSEERPRPHRASSRSPMAWWWWPPARARPPTRPGWCPLQRLPALDPGTSQTATPAAAGASSRRLDRGGHRCARLRGGRDPAAHRVHAEGIPGLAVEVHVEEDRSRVGSEHHPSKLREFSTMEHFRPRIM